MAYDSLIPVSYNFPALNFATGSTSKLKIPNKARMARVLDILVAGTVLFTQVTTPASVQIGDGTTPNIFGQLTIGALASGTTIGAGDATNGLSGAVYLAGNYNSGAGLHDLVATFVAPTGGAPAGTANVVIVVGYDQIPQ
jgi:hypothetical protein